MAEPIAVDNDPAYADRKSLMVTAIAADYTHGYVTPWHSHRRAQLIHAVAGVMAVMTADSQWVVPPTRAIWMPGGTAHRVRMIGEVRMRTAYIRTEASPDLPAACAVLAVSPLLRELIVAAIAVAANAVAASAVAASGVANRADAPGAVGTKAIPLNTEQHAVADQGHDYPSDSREGRLMRLLLDEITVLPELGLRLPHPTNPQLQQLCESLVQSPHQHTTAAQWAARLGVDTKTVHRWFARETAMTFGQWRQQARLLVALERLAAGERVVDVALAVGYDSPAAFSTMFKRQLGVSPAGFFR